MSFVWSTAKKDLLRHLRDPAALAMWIGAPLLVGLLMSLASGGRGGPSPQAHVLVADLDDSFLSNFLLGAMSQEAAGSFIRTEPVALEDGRERIADGDASALLVIPEGFAEGLLREEPVTLELVKNPAQTILPAIVEETLGIFVDAAFYLHRLVGEDLRALADGPPGGESTFPDRFVADFSVGINRTMERLSEYLFPPAIQLEIEAPEEEEDEEEEAGAVKRSPAMFFLPGLLFMSLLFMSQGIAQDLWTERSAHTLRRVVVAPHRPEAFLVGKVLAAAVLMALVCAVALAVAWIYFRLPPANLPLAVVWATVSGVVLLAILMIITMHASTERAAGILSMAIIFPLMMMGGSFFPLEIMPGAFARIGKLTPNGWAMQQLKAIVFDEVDPASLAVAFVGLAVVGILLLLWSARRLRSGFAQA